MLLSYFLFFAVTINKQGLYSSLKGENYQSYKKRLLHASKNIGAWFVKNFSDNKVMNKKQFYKEKAQKDYQEIK